MTIGHVEAVAPQALETAADRQRTDHPNDAEALDRLRKYLNSTQPTLAEIKAAVCEFYAIEPAELFAYLRSPEVAFARQVFCQLAHKYTRFSMKMISQYVGRDHTTVVHAVREIERKAKRPLVADDLDLLRLRIVERIMARPIHGRA